MITFRERETIFPDRMTNDQYRDLCLRSGLKFLVKAAGASALFGDHIKCFRQIAVRMVFFPESADMLNGCGIHADIKGPLHTEDVRSGKTKRHTCG